MISPTTRNFIDSQIDYYITEASSYRQMALTYSEETDDTADVALGIIIGSIYSAFIQYYVNQQQKPSLEDLQEFNKIIKKRAPEIKKNVEKS